MQGPNEYSSTNMCVCVCVCVCVWEREISLLEISSKHVPKLSYLGFNGYICHKQVPFESEFKEI